VDFCAHQLVSLGVSSFNLRSLRYVENGASTQESPGGQAYKQLTKMKISYHNKAFLQQTEPLRLEYLLLNGIYSEDIISLKNVFDFLDKLSETLAPLYLDIRPDFRLRLSDHRQVFSSVTYLLVTKLYLPNS